MNADNVIYTRSIILYVMLGIGIGLFVFSIISIVTIVGALNQIDSIPEKYADECVTYQVLGSGCLIFINLVFCLNLIFFSVFSLFELYFNNNLIVGLKNLNLKFFFLSLGVTTFSFCILGFVYWDNVVELCVDGDPNVRESDIFLEVIIIILFVFSLVVTLIYALVETILIVIGSLKRWDTGSDIIRRLFWCLIYKIRNNNLNNDIRENNLNSQRAREVNENILNIQPGGQSNNQPIIDQHINLLNNEVDDHNNSINNLEEEILRNRMNFFQSNQN